MSDTPKTSALWSRPRAMVVALDEPVVLRRECAQIERELRAERDALRAPTAEFVRDYENGDMSDLKHYARAMRAALKEAK